MHHSFTGAGALAGIERTAIKAGLKVGWRRLVTYATPRRIFPPAPSWSDLIELRSTPAPGVAGRALASSIGCAIVYRDVSAPFPVPVFSARARPAERDAPGAGALLFLFRSLGLTRNPKLPGVGSGDASSPPCGGDAPVAFFQTPEKTPRQPATRASPAPFCDGASQPPAGQLRNSGQNESEKVSNLPQISVGRSCLVALK
jgi:hypothetical protein